MWVVSRPVGSTVTVTLHGRVTAGDIYNMTRSLSQCVTIWHLHYDSHSNSIIMYSDINTMTQSLSLCVTMCHLQHDSLCDIVSPYVIYNMTVTVSLCDTVQHDSHIVSPCVIYNSKVTMTLCHHMTSTTWHIRCHHVSSRLIFNAKWHTLTVSPAVTSLSLL